jgi:hypothetical protein
MQIDIIVAITIFLFFTGWSFYQYSGAHGGVEDLARFSALQLKEKTDSYFFVNYYEVPAVFVSAAPENDTVLYMDFAWDRGTVNSTSVLNASGVPLPCEVSGGRVYWKANLTAGTNNFTITFHETDCTLRCNATLGKAAANQTFGFAEICGKRVSQQKVDNASSMGYGSFRTLLGFSSDFRVMARTNSSLTTIGPAAPKGRNVYSFTSSGRMLDGGSVNITVVVW